MRFESARLIGKPTVVMHGSAKNASQPFRGQRT